MSGIPELLSLQGDEQQQIRQLLVQLRSLQEGVEDELRRIDRRISALESRIKQLEG